MNLAEGNQLIEQKLYRPLQVTIVDLDRPGREGPATRPDLPLQSVGEDRIAAYTAEIMDAIRKLQPQEEARSLFAQYTGALEKISKNLMSLRLTVEQVEGRLYGVIVCEARQPLSAKEIGLIQEYCDGQYGEARSAGYAYCSRRRPIKGCTFISGKKKMIVCLTEKNWVRRSKLGRSPTALWFRKSTRTPSGF